MRDENGDKNWEETFKDYFLERLNLRYLHPIQVLQENGTFSGEGFSILAILCTLVEFLESTVQGLKYRFARQGEKLGEHEYSSSRKIFINFLSTRQPFKQHFDKELAEDFYKSIRCVHIPTHSKETKMSYLLCSLGCERRSGRWRLVLEIRCPRCGKGERSELLEVLPNRRYRLRCSDCECTFVITTSQEAQGKEEEAE